MRPLAITLVTLVVSAAIRSQNFAVELNFTGSSYTQSFFIPPDTMGAVGPNHVVELLNGRYAAYNKTTGALLESSNLNSFWTRAGVTPSGSFAFDPRILYDKASGRWFAVSVDNAGGANNFLVAVSKTNDPTGLTAWTGFQIDSDADNSHWADFETIGVNNDVVVCSANMFPIGTGFARKAFLILPKADLLAAVPSVANATIFEDQDPNNSGFTAQPAFDYDNGTLPLPLLSSYNKPSARLRVSNVTGTALSPSVVSGPLVVVTGRNAPPDIDQPGAKADIDAGDNRFSGNVVKQQIPGRTNPSLWGVHGVDIGGRAAIEWYELDAVTGALLQSGTFSDATLAFNYPSIAVNDFGDVVIGFSGGSPSTYMSTYARVGKTISGTTTFDPLLVTQAGLADYQRLDGIGRNRWGDYSATVVDPSDERVFWTFQLFANNTATNQWSTRITKIRVLNECFLLLGLAPADIAIGKDPADRLLLTPIALYWDVLMRAVPSFHFPKSPALHGLPLYFQVALLNDYVFPQDPVKMSNGLRVRLGMDASQYGKGSGLSLFMNTKPELGKPWQVQFRINN